MLTIPITLKDCGSRFTEGGLIFGQLALGHLLSEHTGRKASPVYCQFFVANRGERPVAGNEGTNATC